MTKGLLFAITLMVSTTTLASADSSWRWNKENPDCHCVTQGTNICSLFTDAKGTNLLLVKSIKKCSIKSTAGHFQVITAPIGGGKFKTNRRGICDISTRQCSGSL